jgi:hypothetical protein
MMMIGQSSTSSNTLCFTIVLYGLRFGDVSGTRACLQANCTWVALADVVEEHDEVDTTFPHKEPVVPHSVSFIL